MGHLQENNLYESIRNEVTKARQKVYTAVNVAMIETYWNIGKQIYEAQGENERAEYGKGLLKYLSKKLTGEFGKGYTVRNLNHMRAFYIAFPNWNALRTNLSWTHYRMLLKIEDEKARHFYQEECEKSNWSTRQLERQINSFYYQRLLSSQDKESVGNEIQTLEKGIDAKDIIRDPYVLDGIQLPFRRCSRMKNIREIPCYKRHIQRII